MVQIEILKKIHDSDIKDGVERKGYLYTVGRDKMIRVTRVSDLTPVWNSEDLGTVANSVCIRGSKLYAGLQTGEIMVYEIQEGSGAENFSLKLQSRSKVHKDNVCSISIFREGVISTSWDKTIGIVYENKEAEVVYLESIAWCAREQPETGIILAGCIDGGISVIKKINERYKKTKGLKVHSTCIRDILMEKDRYLSLSNTGVVIMAEYSGRTIHHVDLDNTSFRISKYSVGEDEGYLVSSDEGMVYLLSSSLEKVASIAIPSLSCWMAVSYSNRIAVFASDGRVYVFEDKAANEAYLKEMEALQDALNSKKVQKSTDAPESSSAANSQIHDDSNAQYKVVDDKVYVLKDGIWELFGNTVEKKKKDHTITITLGSSNYSLSFDKTERHEDVACRFVKENHLSSEYISEIVEFLDVNFKKKKLKKDVSRYILYDTIDMDNVGKRIENLPNSKKVVDFLAHVQRENSVLKASDNRYDCSEIEVILSEWLENGKEETVAVLDIYKYLISKGIDFDLFFLKNLNVFSSKKIALVFSMISINVLAMRPECKPLVDGIMGKVIDKQLVSPKIIQNYKYNRQLLN